MEFLLKDLKWKLKGFWPFVPLLRNSVETGTELQGVTEWITAEVPGSVYKDLFRAGIIKDPYYEKNSLECEWVSNRWWMYKTEFDMEKDMQDLRLYICLKGIDYKGHIYLNRIKLGEQEGMFSSCRFDITNIVREKSNELVVILENAPEEVSQIGYTERTRTQKSRFNYKWDFCTRLVNLGIYDDVVLQSYGSVRIEETQIQSSLVQGFGKIDVECKLNGDISSEVSIISELTLNGERISYENQKRLIVKENEGTYLSSIDVVDPKIWYPNGLGEQNLYDLKINVFDQKGLSDEKIFRVGIRSLEYLKSENAPEGSLPYTPVINGEKVYIKGVNMVPLDQMYGCVADEDYRNMLKLAKSANINLIRVWGGGVIEKEVFYNLCDEYGIMVWQEFIQSSSGISNVPSEIPEFLQLLSKTSEEAVKGKRNHVSLTFWSGGNELTDGEGVPVTYDNGNISILKDIVRKFDPQRLFLPTSGSGPSAYLNICNKNKNHDVHGPWKYEGTEKHYHTFNESDSLLHSEFGVDGMSELDSLEKFLSDKNTGLYTMQENDVWRHHGEWWDTLARDQKIFGEFMDLDIFIKCSQFIQAEGIRYALEANRRRMFENSGSIVWQLNEPWPNVSCTSLIDYYQKPKWAYFFMKDAFRPVNVSLRYEKLLYKEEDVFKAQVFVSNDLDQNEAEVECEILNHLGEVQHYQSHSTRIKGQATTFIAPLNWKIGHTKGGFYIKIKLHMVQYGTVESFYLLLVDDYGAGHMKKEVIKYYEATCNDRWIK